MVLAPKQKWEYFFERKGEEQDYQDNSLINKVFKGGTYYMVSMETIERIFWI